MLERAFISGCDRGLGYALAALLCSKGWEVFAGCNSPSGIEAYRVLPGKVLPLSLDVASDESVLVAAAATAERTDALGLLINNAGVLGKIEDPIDGPPPPPPRVGRGARGDRLERGRLQRRVLARFVVRLRDVEGRPEPRVGDPAPLAAQAGRRRPTSPRRPPRWPGRTSCARASSRTRSRATSLTRGGRCRGKAKDSALGNLPGSGLPSARSP